MKSSLQLLIFVGALTGRVFAGDAVAPPPMLSLADAQQIALKNHPQIAAANFHAQAVQETVKENRAGYFPTANLYGNAVAADSEQARILAGGINNPSVFNRVAGGLAVSQLLLDFGRTPNLVASSKFQAQAADQNANATREQVLLNVDTDYLDALEAQAVLHVAQQTLDTRQLLLDKVTLLASNKLKSDLDVSFARVAYEEGRLLLQKAQNDADNAMTSLSTALGYREPHPYQLVEPPPFAIGDTNDVSQLVQSALAARPELLSLRNEQRAAQDFAKAQRDSRLPTVAAVGMVGGSPWHDSHLPDNYAVGGVQLSLPLFAGGLYSARQHEAEFTARSTAEHLRAAEDEVVRDVHLAWSNLNNALEQLHTTGQLVSSAKDSYSLAQARYQIGSSSIVELSQAQLSLTSAEIADTNARYNVLIRQAQLNYETGALR